MCTKNFDYEALTLRELRDKRGVDLDRVSKMDVIRGRMIVEYRDGEFAVDEPVKDFHGAALKGCDECADFLGRSADISVGSVGSMDGWTSVLIRTERGRLAFQAARAKLDVRGLDDPAALLRLDALDKKIANRSLQRKLDPDAPLFIDFEEHVRAYDGTRPPARVHPPLTVTCRTRRCTCPTSPRLGPQAWLAAVLDGRRPRRVLARDGRVGRVVVVPLEPWRGRPQRARSSRRIVLGYRREIWLWLAGERTWAQCCSGPHRPGRAGALAQVDHPAGECRLTIGGAVIALARRRGPARGHRSSTASTGGRLADERWVVLGPERIREDDAAAGGRGPAVADRRDGGDPRAPASAGSMCGRCARGSRWSAAR